MSLESVFKLSLIMNMIDNLSGPMAGVASKVGANVSKLDAASQTFGSMAKAGAAMQETGSQIVNAVLAPVEATFETRRALGELASLGVQDLEAVENAARNFSDQWAGTSKADFISAAYDIKSGIASLSDEGVAEFTSLAALTAKATKSTAGEMTSLFATGYGIYKDYYSDLSDMEFGGGCPVSQPVTVEGRLRNKAGVLLCTLEASTTLHCVCDRCAKPFSKDKTVTYQCVLAEERQSDDDEDIVLLEHDEVDLGEVARTAFILEMDSKNLCSPDCKGLCPGCGADLNVEPCRCKKAVDPRRAKLAQLLEDR